MLELFECKRDNLCVDCDDEKCKHCGDIAADCPKYHCDNNIILDCKHCAFIKNYQKNFRNKELFKG